MLTKLHRVLLLVHPLVCFSLFGLGGAVLCFSVFPLVHVFSKNSESAQARVRIIISKGFKLFLFILESTGRIKFSVSGTDRLAQTKPALILANHPTLIDVIVLISLVPQATCIVKGALLRHSIFRRGIRLAGYISGNTEQEAVFKAVTEMNKGHSLVIFPEGTRSEPSSLGKFKRGAATIALMTNYPIIPVLIEASPPILTKGQKWRDFSRLTKISIHFGAAIHGVEIVENCRNNAVSRRKLTTYLQDYFEVQLDHGGRASASGRT